MSDVGEREETRHQTHTYRERESERERERELGKKVILPDHVSIALEGLGE